MPKKLAARSTWATIAWSTRSTWSAWTTTWIAWVVHVSGAIVAATDLSATNWIRLLAHRNEFKFACKLRRAAAGAWFCHAAWTALAFGSRAIVLEAIAAGALAVPI